MTILAKFLVLSIHMLSGAYASVPIDVEQTYRVRCTADVLVVESDTEVPNAVDVSDGSAILARVGFSEFYARKAHTTLISLDDQAVCTVEIDE